MRQNVLTLLMLTLWAVPAVGEARTIQVIRGGDGADATPAHARPKGKASEPSCYSTGEWRCSQLPRDCRGVRLGVGEGTQAWDATFPDGIYPHVQAGFDGDWAVAMVPGGLEWIFRDERRMRVRLWDELTPVEREKTRADEQRAPWHKVEETSAGLRVYVPFQDDRRVGSSVKMLRAFYVDLDTGEVRRVERKEAGARVLHVKLSEAKSARARLTVAAQLRDLAARRGALEDPELTPALAAASLHADEEVAEHALWGLWRLGRDLTEAPPLHLTAALRQAPLSEACSAPGQDRALLHAATPLPALQHTHARALAQDARCAPELRGAALTLLEGHLTSKDLAWLEPLARKDVPKVLGEVARARVGELNEKVVPALEPRAPVALATASARLPGTEPIPLKELPLPDGVQKKAAAASGCTAVAGASARLGAAPWGLLLTAAVLRARRRRAPRSRLNPY